MFLTEATYKYNNSIANKSFDQYISEGYELELGYNELKMKMMKLEHVAIMNNDRALLEEGEQNFFQKIWEFIKKIYNNIKGFILKIANYIKQFFSSIIAKFKKSPNAAAEAKQAEKITAKDVHSAFEQLPAEKKETYTITYKSNFLEIIKNADSVLKSDMVKECKKLEAMGETMFAIKGGVNEYIKDGKKEYSEMLKGGKEVTVELGKLDSKILEESKKVYLSIIRGTGFQASYEKVLKLIQNTNEKLYKTAESKAKDLKENDEKGRKKLDNIKNGLTELNKILSDVLALFRSSVQSATVIFKKSISLTLSKKGEKKAEDSKKNAELRTQDINTIKDLQSDPNKQASMFKKLNALRQKDGLQPLPTSILTPYAKKIVEGSKSEDYSILDLF